jgi:hypothetical protein
MKKLLILIFSISLAGCYRIPGENDFSIIPATNNPEVTGERPGSAMPGMKY